MVKDSYLAMLKRMEGKLVHIVNALRYGTRSSKTAESEIIQAYMSNADNPFLVSFPRTGSHWFRMLCELYFEHPTLVRMFYYPEKTDYLFLHRHDEDLSLERRNVIYLYREPVGTIYSLLRYHNEDPDDTKRIAYWADLYGQHLNKWLHQERFTTKKTIITYEAMQSDLPAVFEKVTAHLGHSLDRAQLEQVARQVTKEEVKRKTALHDGQVIQLEAVYQKTGVAFAEQSAQLVWENVLMGRDHLRQDFD